MIPTIDKSQFFNAISEIDELYPINFSDKCCGKFSMCLKKLFFLVNQILQKCFSLFFKKTEQFTHSDVALNKTKQDFLNCHNTLLTPCIIFIAPTC